LCVHAPRRFALPSELVDRIRNLAERHERSLGGQLRWALGEYYLDNELEYGMIRFARGTAAAQRRQQLDREKELRLQALEDQAAAAEQPSD
jgi:hypothetical protein